jgi:SAM-dependent methyltransferase
MTDIPKSRAFQPPTDWEAVFASTPASSFFGREPSAIATSAFRYLRAFGIEPAACVALDLGSGEGRDTVYLASAGIRVVSVDIAPSGIEKTRAMLGKAGVPEDRVDLRITDVREYEYPEHAFDLALAANVFQFLPPDDARIGIRNLQRTVKPGGICGVGVFSPAMAEWGTDISPYFTATADDLLAYFPESEGWLLCDRTEYWILRPDDQTMGSFAFVVARKVP